MKPDESIGMMFTDSIRNWWASHRLKDFRQSFLAHVIAFATVLAAANIGAALWRLQGKEPPEYGTWTGVLEVERKVRLLREFAREGEVDVLILSSSMGDYGVSAEVLSREISAGLGRSFRVFNFSIGGADFTTYPLLYRLARLVCKPRQIWIVTPVSNTPRQSKEDSLDEKLLSGPVGSSQNLPVLLPLSFAFHDLALVRNAAAMRDLTIYQRFPHRPASNLDFYEINRHGDTRSWLYNVTEYGRGATRRVDRYDEIMKFVKQPNAKEHVKHHGIYFPAHMLSAVADMRSLASRDNAAISLIAFDSAVSLTLRDGDYLEGSYGFFEPLSRYFEAPVIDVRALFDAKPYMISDPIHLNTIGAEEFSKLLAARITGKPAPAPVELAVSAQIRHSMPDPRWTAFTALVVKRRDDPSATLELQYFQSWGIPPMRPFSNVRVAVRLPDGSEPVLRARVLAGGRVLADTSSLPLDADQILTAQLVPWTNAKMGAGGVAPLASYRWSSERRPPGFYEEGFPAVERASTTYSTLESISVSWERLADPAKLDWIGLFPVGGNGASRISFDFTGGKEAGKLVLPPVPQVGQFELRLFRDNGWESIASSKPFTVTASSGTVAVADTTVAAGQSVRVSWSDLNHPHKQDWVGLFRKGAKDESRMDIRYTGGAKDGTLQIPVAESTPPGEYEVRLFSSGGWTRLGTSAPFTIVAPQGSPRP